MHELRTTQFGLTAPRNPHSTASGRSVQPICSSLRRESNPFYLAYGASAFPPGSTAVQRVGIEPTCLAFQTSALTTIASAARSNWKRETDLHRRSPGYEPGKLLLLHPAVPEARFELAYPVGRGLQPRGLPLPNYRRRSSTYTARRRCSRKKERAAEWPPFRFEAESD